MMEPHSYPQAITTSTKQNETNDVGTGGGAGMTFNPEGDPDGRGEDEYPGSLFVMGHAHFDRVSEVSIPEPVISSRL